MLGHPLHTVSDKPTTESTATSIYTATLNTTTITSETSFYKWITNIATSAKSVATSVDIFKLKIGEKFPRGSG
jgi:hypothetical protein